MPIANTRSAATLFYAISLLVLPITLIGYVIWLARIFSAWGGFAVATVATESH